MNLKGLFAKLKYAFAIESSEDTFSAEEIALLDKFTTMVIKRQMATPAVMFLESVRPLNFIGSQVMVFFQPLVSLFFSGEEYEMLARIFERRKSVGILIEIIEQKQRELDKVKKPVLSNKS